MTQPTIDDVIKHIREEYERRQQERRDTIRRLTEAVRDYELAVSSAMLAELARRNGVQAPTAITAEDAALNLLALVEVLPELQPPTAPECSTCTTANANDTQSGDEEEPPRADVLSMPPPNSGVTESFQYLGQRSKTHPIVLIGGIAVEAKLRWVRNLGLTVEWLDAKDNGSSVRSLPQRVQAQTVCGVIVLNELMGHAPVRTIQNACTAANVYCAMGRKGGQGQLLEVFRSWERRLAERAAP